MELVEILFEDRGVVEGVNEGGEVVDVFCEGGDAVGVYPFDVWGEGKCLESVRRVEEGGGGKGERGCTRIMFAAWERASK